MALTYQLYNKQCFQAEWTVVVPRVGYSVAKYFNYPGASTCCFSLQSDFCPSEQNERWKIDVVPYLLRKPDGRFLLTVYVRSKDGRNVFMSYTEVKDERAEVWSGCRNSFLRSYPNVDFSGNTLTFLFTFDFDIFNHRESPREHKSVQTCFHDYQSLENLSLDLLKLTEGSDPDVRLKCGNCTIPAHRLILGARSEVFRTILHNHEKEGRGGAVEIVDIEPEVFQTFIRYLYTGNLPELSEDTALPLYEAADKYHVNALRNRCSDFLAEHLPREKACEVLAMADAHSNNDLKDHVISYILDENIPNDDDEWSEFCDRHPKLAIEVLRRFYKQSASSQ